MSWATPGGVPAASATLGEPDDGISGCEERRGSPTSPNGLRFSGVREGDSLEPEAQSAEPGSAGRADPGAAREAPIHPRSPTPWELPKARWRPSNLTLRWITAAILVPPVIWACYVGGPGIVVVVITIAVFAVNEFYNLISQKGATPHRLLGTLAVASLPIVFYVGDAFWATSFMTMLLLTVMILQLTKIEIREAIASVSATFFGVFYVGWLLSHAVSVRHIESYLSRRYPGTPAAELDPEIGFFFMMLCVVGAVLCDAGAYFVGRRYGRRQLAPRISPKKTVEGAIGGVLVGAAGAVVTKWLFDYVIPGRLSADFSVTAAAVFGMAIAVVAILGDLIESVLKRDADLKDAGALLPGVGGMLDRIDSSLLAIPVMYYLLIGYYYLRFVA